MSNIKNRIEYKLEKNTNESQYNRGGTEKKQTLSKRREITIKEEDYENVIPYFINLTPTRHYLQFLQSKKYNEINQFITTATTTATTTTTTTTTTTLPEIPHHTSEHTMQRYHKFVIEYVQEDLPHPCPI